MRRAVRSRRSRRPNGSGRASPRSTRSTNTCRSARPTSWRAPYGMEGVCLRLFNVYGPGQALSNPYTGVLAIFASRLLNGQQPMIFEDGEQRRDFVHVTRCRARLRRCAGAAAGGRAARSTSARARTAPSPRSRPMLAKAMGKNQHRARDRRQGADRRYPPLLLRHLSRRRTARLRGAAGFRCGAGRTRRMGRAADRARTALRRCAPSSRRGGWWHDAAPAIRARSSSPAAPASSAPILPIGWRPRVTRSSSTMRCRAPACRAISTGWSHATATGSSRSSPTSATRRGWPTPPRARRPCSTWRRRSR